MHRSTLRYLLLTSAISFAPAHASIIQVSTTAALLDSFGNGTYGSCGVGVTHCSEGGAAVTVTTNPVISLSASASAPAPGLTDGAGGQVEWSVDVLGGTPGDQVTLDVRYFMSAVGNSNDSGADIEFNGAPLATVCDSCGGGIPTSLSGVKQVIGTAGGANDFTEVVGANGFTSADGSFSSHSTVYADPYIYIDPDFATANPGYSLDFGDAGNALAASAPEPSGLWFALAGAAAFALRSRTRAARKS